MENDIRDGETALEFFQRAKREYENLSPAAKKAAWVGAAVEAGDIDAINDYSPEG